MDGDHDLHTIAFRAAIAGANAIQAVSADQLATHSKGGIEDFVTAADLASEQAIINSIRRSRPDDQIIAEETGTHPGSSGISWYVDPLDGTANIVAGSPDYAVCISAHRDLKPLAAIIYRPADDLWLATSVADRLHGTLKPRLAMARPLDATRVTVSRPHDPVRRDEAMALRQALLPHVGQEERVGSAACALLRVAIGDLDAYVSVDLPMWDTAAGHHLVTLAGGLVTTITSSAGTPITVAGAPTATDAITALLATMSTQPSYMESLKPNLT